MTELLSLEGPVFASNEPTDEPAGEALASLLRSVADGVAALRRPPLPLTIRVEAKPAGEGHERFVAVVSGA